jgi:hypothetical protein
MSNYLQISIPESCHESWNGMLPNQKGRHCQSCQKTVVDFTNMTDAELIGFFKKNNRNACGRFSNDQLQRDILIPRKKINWMKYFFQVALPAFMLSIKPSFNISAQKQATKVSTVPVQRKTLDSIPEINIQKQEPIVVPASPDAFSQMLVGTVGAFSVVMTKKIKYKTLIGKVVDEKGVPLPYASIVIKGGTRGTSSDSLGNFIFSNLPLKATIVASYVGYEPKEISVKSAGNSTIIIVKLSQQVMGEVVVVSGTSRRKRKKQAEAQIEICTVASTKIYPNPIASTSILNIAWTNPEAGSYSVQITNLQGQVVQVEKLEVMKKQTASSFNLKSIVAGTYAVIITNTKTGKHFSHQLIVR